MMHGAVHHTHLNNVVKSRVVIGNWCGCMVVGKFSFLQRIKKKELTSQGVCVGGGYVQGCWKQSEKGQTICMQSVRTNFYLF